MKTQADLQANQAALADYVAQPYCSDLWQRWSAGDVRITFGPQTWQDHHYTEPYKRVSIPLVVELAMALPTANDFHISYCPKTDFHHIRFAFDGDVYVLRWYKTFILHRQSDRNRIDFGFRKNSIADWFKAGKHATSVNWREEAYPPHDPFDPFNQPDAVVAESVVPA